ncbi:ABC transporter transmembrane domain-containing protein [Chelatococcus sp. SYSU_G07232]|uniref:ABC transporter transmembrane domain-containing protein n=1 Tax=Chelatococcus albus TaxID=3047466 RepID=A0ABT7AHH6_9HYPH|nr:ABC transporter transmembrane domain-containing protein [Chelatococcus sp. SYSU_G07232]MDJ1158809.1 ABC transporter transmembrane domain-containing protein [Chelatococcus sp. SYSU_G07232]
MERDPIRYVWQKTRIMHLVAGLLVLALVPASWSSLALLRTLVDDAALGRAFADGQAAAALLAVEVTPPRAFGRPWMLFEGFVLPRETFAIAAAAGLFGLVALRTALITSLRSVGDRLATDLGHDLRTGLFQRIVSARPSAQDEATAAAAQIGNLATVSPFLGRALLTPLAAGADMATVLLFGFVLHRWLGLTLLVAVILQMLLPAAREDAERRVAEDGGRMDRRTARAAREAVRRLPAIRAHGTAQVERTAFAAQLRKEGRAERDALTWRLALRAAARLLREGAPAAVVAIGAWLVAAGDLSPGGLVAASIAVIAVARPATALARWRRDAAAARAVFDEIGRCVGALQARAARRPLTGALPATLGTVETVQLGALDPRATERVAGVDVKLALAQHVALVGEGARAFGAALGGAVEPTAGQILVDGTDLASVPAHLRARRIAYTGCDPVLLDARLRDNLLYGVAPVDAREAAALDERLIAAVTVAGLDAEVYALGLEHTVDPRREPRLAEAIVEARRAVRRTLSAEGLDGLVDPFAPERYNRHATVAENLLFGVAVGDTFGEAHLAAHPFLRAVLEAEELTKPLVDMGLAIATSMVEIFAGISEGHPLFAQFSFFAPGERSLYEELVARRTERRRGHEAGRDRDRLIALALRYVETRHRLGLLDERLEARVVAARATFAKLLPAGLQPAVEFYDPDRLCTAASLSDNLLFGRIAYDVAGAGERVHTMIRKVLAAQELDADVFRIGLEAHVAPRDGELLSLSPAVIDLARCLVRQPDILIVDRVFEGLSTAQADALVARLRAALKGRTLLAVLPEGLDRDGFDRTLAFARGGLVGQISTRSTADA